MKYLTTFLCITLLVAFKPINELDEAVVKQVMVNHLESKIKALERFDEAQFASLFAKDVLIIDAGEIKTDIHTYMSDLKMVYSKIQFINHNMVSIKINAPHVFTTESYNYEFTERMTGRKRQGIGVVSCVFEKLDNRWQIIQYQVSQRQMLP